MKFVAAILTAAVIVTSIPANVIAATENDVYKWDMSVKVTAGAHHAIDDTVVLSDTEINYIVSAIIKGETPVVAEPEQEIAEQEMLEPEVDEALAKAEEEARLAAEEEARRIAAEEEARRAAEEAARIEANRKQQYANAANKTYNPPSGTGGQAVVDYALQFVGNPYVLGGSSLTNGIDCSNFVMRVYEAFGVSLPHNSYKLREVGYEVSADEIKAGDIICYQGHVSIYMGDGRCVHAANSEDGIKISPKWNYTKVITIRRIFDN